MVRILEWPKVLHAMENQSGPQIFVQFNEVSAIVNVGYERFYCISIAVGIRIVSF